jgi:hypothetical protein
VKLTTPFLAFVSRMSPMMWYLTLSNEPTNQPTKRLIKGGVRRRRETSSLVRSNHSCVRNALLEMVNGALN